MSVVMEQPEEPTSTQRAALLHIIESTLKVQTPSEFLAWTEGELQTLFPHEILICGVGKIDWHSIHIHRYLCAGFPLSYIEAIRQADHGVLSPIMARWCKERKPQLFQPGKIDTEVDGRWLAIFRQHDLRNIAAHGMRDMSSNVASYFNFSRIPGQLTPRHAYLLELLVPHMHVALTRVLAQDKHSTGPSPAAQPNVTPREREVLRWLCEGKTNGEIAQILGVSGNTVKNQVRGILVKLRVNNRTQAVSKVLSGESWD